MSSKRLHGRYAYIGPPGCGKTTKLTKMVKAIVEDLGISPSGERSPVVVASLTKTAAQEVAGRGLPIPKQAIGTLHAHCYAALDRPKLVTPKDLADFNEKHPAFALGSTARDAIDEERIVDPYTGNENPGDEMMSEYMMLRARRVDRDAYPDHLIDFVETWEEWKTSIERFDFTDLIESVLTHGIEHPMRPEVIVADETQDFSALEFDLVRMWGDQAGTLILAGDPYQSLYSWRGAHPEALTGAEIPEDRRFVLSQSYRVPESVQRLAMRVIEPLTENDASYKYAPRVGDDGDVVKGAVHPTGGTWRQPSEVVSLACDLAAEGKSVMIAGTCAHMMHPIVKQLRTRAVAFANPWRPHDGSWNPLNTAGTSMSSRLVSLFRPMTEPREGDEGIPGILEDDGRMWWSWKDVDRFTKIMTTTGIIKHGMKAKIPELAKNGNARLARFEMSEVFSSWFLDSIEHAFDTGKISSVLELVASRVSSRYRRSFDYVSSVMETRGVDSVIAPRVYVGTIHSFKGAEADEVILFPDLANKAAKAWLEGDGEAYDSILRAFYVGVTRARSRLWIARACGYAIPLDQMRSEIMETNE